jgi:hypothetical protein
MTNGAAAYAPIGRRRQLSWRARARLSCRASSSGAFYFALAGEKGGCRGVPTPMAASPFLGGLDG